MIGFCNPGLQILANRRLFIKRPYRSHPSDCVIALQQQMDQGTDVCMTLQRGMDMIT